MALSAIAAAWSSLIKSVAEFRKPVGTFREVLDCGSPLPLSRRKPAVERRQRAAAVQDAGAQFGIAKSFRSYSFFETALNSGLGKTFADATPQMLLVVRLITTARDQSLHRIQQFQPVFQRRFGNALPLVKPLSPVKEKPFPTDPLRIHLQLEAVLRHPSPTDLSFGHRFP